MSLPQTVTINDDVICQEIGGQTVLLNPVSGGYFGLDPISSFIWQLLQTTGSVADVLACMTEAFPAQQSRLEADLQAFLAQLQAAQLIHAEATRS